MNVTHAERYRSFAGLEAALSEVQTPSADISDLIIDLELPDFTPEIGDNQQRHGGSGVLLTKDGFILTAFHVVASYVNFLQSLVRYNYAAEAELFLDKARGSTEVRLGQNTYPLDLTTFIGSKTIDFALVKAMLPGDPVPTGVRLAQEPPRIGEFITANGFDRQFPGKISEVEGITVRKSDIPTYITTTAAGLPGMSGGAFINGRGKYAGMPVLGWKAVDASAGPTAQYIRGVMLPYVQMLKERRSSLLSALPK